MQSILNKKTLHDVNLKDKHVIVRVDFNVPVKDGKVVSNKRIQAALPTIKYLLAQNCKIILLSHLSRIKTIDDIKSGKKSLAPVAYELQVLLPDYSVKFVDASRGAKVEDAVRALEPQNIILLQNTRYNDVDENGEVVKLESKCNMDLGKEWAGLANVFVNDAFGTAHRKHASNVGIALNIPESCIGFLIQEELDNLSKITTNAKKPVVAILGGAKVSDKLKVINNLLNIANKVLICGGMAYTFRKAQGIDIGTSLIEEEMLPEAKKLLELAGNRIILSQDFYCATEFADVTPTYRKASEGLNGVMGLDIGPDTVQAFTNALKGAGTVFWNGPAGVFEFANFQRGTKTICQLLKDLTSQGAFTLIGGGDSASAATGLGFQESDFSFISTGGGASLEFIEGSPLPGIESISNK